MSDPKCPNCGKSLLECQGFCEKKGMGDKIAEIMKREETSDLFPPYQVLPKGHEDWIELKVNQILSLTHDDWEMVEECKDYDPVSGLCEGVTIGWCNEPCKNGEITRPATINEILQGLARRIE